jgi:hypothetical protein
MHRSVIMEWLSDPHRGWCCVPNLNQNPSLGKPVLRRGRPVFDGDREDPDASQ